MNYIELVNNFWSLNKEYSFTPNEKAVYFALLNICNELGWKNPFNQSNAYLSLDAGMSESAMSKARNTLKQKGLIEFSSGDGRRNNTVYFIKETKKGSKKGSFKNDLNGDLSDTLSGDLSGDKHTDNIKLKTKQKKTKSISSPDGSDNEKKLLYWSGFVKKWNEWYLSRHESNYNYLPKDFAHLKKIYQFLEKRAFEKNVEFSEPWLIDAFEYFLNKAWEKDDWLRKNFSIPNVLSQFNQIINDTARRTNTQQSGKGFSGGKHAGANQLLNGFQQNIAAVAGGRHENSDNR